MRAGSYTFQPESTLIKASSKRGNPKETKDLYRLRNFFLCKCVSVRLSGRRQAEDFLVFRVCFCVRDHFPIFSSLAGCGRVATASGIAPIAATRSWHHDNGGNKSQRPTSKSRASHSL